MTNPPLTKEFIEALFIHDRVNGVLIWKQRNSTAWNTHYAGKPAGGKKHYKERIYIKIGITINGKAYRYAAHQLIWMLLKGEWPSMDIDHKDTDGLNNKEDNLRLASDSQNLHNAKTFVNNTSGYRGVYWNKRAQRWMAAISINGKSIHLGYFDNPKHAYRKYCRTKRQLVGEFARV